MPRPDLFRSRRQPSLVAAVALCNLSTATSGGMPGGFAAKPAKSVVEYADNDDDIDSVNSVI